MKAGGGRVPFGATFRLTTAFSGTTMTPSLGFAF